MDSERREHIRRSEDVMSHAELVVEVRSVREDINTHVHPEIHRIIDVLEGPCVELLDGTRHREEESGIVQRLYRMEAMLNNGIKIKQSLTGKDKAQIIAAIVAAAGVVIAAGIT